MEAPETLTIADAADLLHADPETVMHLARRGELPGTKIGKSWVFLRSDALAFLTERIRADTAKRRNSRLAAPDALALLMPVPPRGRRRPVPELPSLPIAKEVKPLP
ncbi:helix-turn-helix domain-containing protein [Rugamonas apoptosis]|uniref:Helix-turn-helix domain-containing protein n=1 Tax=Rugamonas apoptosis TaxID=2758570 RepID=A0A7W2IJX2_9BURK|nr:helix-turn-helix domain-containing protein [Rugamonas apoptosis]MBA5687210.1 helix-turn-helix domain-containing protein [Rugamonas apoptosis]